MADLEPRMVAAERAILALQISNKHLEADVAEIKESISRNHIDLTASIRDLATNALNAAPEWAVRQIGWAKWVVGLLMGGLASATTALLWEIFKGTGR